MATYPAAVERWRPYLEAEGLSAAQVDKALFVIQHESGGDPGAVGDGGAARGLFQIQDSRNFSNRPDSAWLDNPRNNISYAVNQLGIKNGDWSAWGEGTTYNGQVFGALGNNPYQGAGDLNTREPSGGSLPEIPELPFSEDDYLTKTARYNALGVSLFDPYTGAPKDPSDPRLNEYFQLDAELTGYEDARDRYGQDWSTYLDVRKYNDTQDPSRIAAENAANRWGREFNVRTQALQDTANDIQEQRQGQDAAVGEFNSFLQTPAAFKGPTRVPSFDLPTKDELFAGNIARVKEGLPDVPDVVARPQITGAFGRTKYAAEERGTYEPSIMPGANGSGPWSALPSQRGTAAAFDASAVPAPIGSPSMVANGRPNYTTMPRQGFPQPVVPGVVGQRTGQALPAIPARTNPVRIAGSIVDRLLPWGRR